ncbi:MAG: RNase P modulator RnpM [Bacillus sp. (in: firmicutes)]
MAGQKKVPMRKCVATGTMKPKKEMIRVVRSKEGEISIDPTGKKSGRGAYVSLDRDAILQAKKKDILARHLDAPVPEEIYSELIRLAEQGK